MNRIVRDYHGNKIRIICEEADVQKEVFEKLVTPFASELEFSWMTNTNAENHVKNYLSYIGSLMIRQPEEHNVVADRKMRKIKGMEIASDVAEAKKVKATIAPGKRRSKKSDRTVRVDRLHKKHPDITFEFCTVDTLGYFSYRGDKYMISSDLKQYSPQKAGENDSFYAMDQIAVAVSNGHMMFCDQFMEVIDSKHIIKLATE